MHLHIYLFCSFVTSPWTPLSIQWKRKGEIMRWRKTSLNVPKINIFHIFLSRLETFISDIYSGKVSAPSVRQYDIKHLRCHLQPARYHSVWSSVWTWFVSEFRRVVQHPAEQFTAVKPVLYVQCLFISPSKAPRSISQDKTTIPKPRIRLLLPW